MVRAQRYGIYFIFKSMEQGPTFRCTVPKYPTRDPNHRILAPQRSRFTPTTSTFATRPWAHCDARGLVLPVPDHLLSQRPLVHRAGVESGRDRLPQKRQRFSPVDDPAALQAAADRLSPALIRERLDYWTLLLGPKFSAKERALISVRRFYAISQIEYCRNFIFKRHFPIHKSSSAAVSWGCGGYPSTRSRRSSARASPKKLHGNLNNHSRANRARPSHLSCLLEARVCQAVREVRHLPAQRGLLQQSGGLGLRKGSNTWATCARSSSASPSASPPSRPDA